MIESLNWQNNTQSDINIACANLNRIEYRTANLNIAISSFVVISNAVIKYLVISLCKEIGFTTKTMMVFYERKIILAMQFMNSIVIILLMGAKLDFMPLIGKLFMGDYRDFTEKWYRVIGSIFVTTTIFFIFGPIIEIIVNYALEKWYFFRDQGICCG